MAVTSWSIQREDVMLLRALRGVNHDNGFYIDVGANAPDEHSVTKLFYDHGWRGINIEPSPYWHKKLLEERPRDINVHAAASDRPGTLTLYDHPEGGLGTIVEEFADRHIGDWGIDKRPVEVQALTLTQICERYAAADIHFLKIDVEGFEEQVIRGMDFSRFRPWIICVEATEPMKVHVHTHGSWDPLLITANYTFVMFDGLNRWYVAKEHPERLDAFNYPTDDFIHYSHVRRMEDLERQVADLSVKASSVITRPHTTNLPTQEKGASKELFDLFKSRIDRPLTLIDVGAAGGALSNWMEFGDKANIYCFEARDDEATNLGSSNQKSNIEYVPIALSNDNKGIRLTVTKNGGCSSVYPPVDNIYQKYPSCDIMEPIRTVDCPSTTIDEFLASRGIETVDAIKLDTQGSEPDILRGAEKALKSAKFVFLETELNELYKGQPLFCDVDRFLRDRGFVLWRFNNLAHYSTGVSPGSPHWMQVGSDPGGQHYFPVPNGQLFWADAFYVKAAATPVNDDSLGVLEAVTGAALVSQWNFWDLALEMIRKTGDDRLLLETKRLIDKQDIGPFGIGADYRTSFGASDYYSNPPQGENPFSLTTDFSVTDGCIFYGPYARMPVGEHEVTFYVRANVANQSPLKSSILFDVAMDTKTIAIVSLSGEEGSEIIHSGKVAVRFENTNHSGIFEFRIHTDGVPFDGNLEFMGVTIKRID